MRNHNPAVVVIYDKMMLIPELFREAASDQCRDRTCESIRVVTRRAQCYATLRNRLFDYRMRARNDDEAKENRRIDRGSRDRLRTDSCCSRYRRRRISPIRIQRTAEGHSICKIVGRIRRNPKSTGIDTNHPESEITRQLSDNCYLQRCTDIYFERTLSTRH